MSQYKAVIGLEIHAELDTKTKMFCNSRNDADEKRPNANICPICLGHPGTLPVINKQAIKHVLRVGLAVGGKIADYSEFDRKNYFYPDIPKGYQISQYKHPLIDGGELLGVKLTRIHLEEDTAKSTHDRANFSLIDFNRAGVPLMELVTKPVISSGKEASDFAKELQLLLLYLGASKANMEKGEMRVEANISVSPDDKIIKNQKDKKEYIAKSSIAEQTPLGTKVEVKNLNSFRAVERAINYEIQRHIDVLEKGENVIQETRGWDESKQITFSQRLKEQSHDYRYFPDPDLPNLKISEIEEFSKENLMAKMPELPSEKRARYKESFGLNEREIATLIDNRQLADYFEKVISSMTGGKNNKEGVKIAVNYLLSDYIGALKAKSQSPTQNINFNVVNAENFGKLVKMIIDGELTSRGAKNLILLMIKNDNDPQIIAKENGLIQENNEDELKKIIEQIIKDNKKVADEYKSGKIPALQFLIGQAMKKTKGSSNPKAVEKLLRNLIL